MNWFHSAYLSGKASNCQFVNGRLTEILKKTPPTSMKRYLREKMSSLQGFENIWAQWPEGDKIHLGLASKS